MLPLPLHVGLCGFGGQGIILSAVILGTTAVTKSHLHAVQTQSYGSEARGGQCQAELIIDSKPINSPVSDKKDLLVCMFQNAYDKYISSLKEDGILIVDPKLVTRAPGCAARTFRVPATEIAIAQGNRMAANMVMLGFLSEYTRIVGKEDMKAVIADSVSERFRELNLKAFEAGVAYACGHAGEKQARHESL
jgi:2-oxoglutarate ferredoxin oxidoreductase subunit gamma